MIFRLLVILPALAVALAIPAAAQQLTEQEARQVAQNIADHFSKAAKAKDAAGIGANYTDDAVSIADNGDVLLGRAAIEKFYAKASKNFDAGPSHIIKIKIINNETIVVFGSWSGIGHGDNGPTHLGGRWVDTDVRVGDGWKIAAATSHWRSRSPSP